MSTYQAIIVDDEPLVRLAFRQYIGSVSSTITLVGEAGDGIEAMELLQSRDDIDIVFADIQMPRMNGLELLTSISQASFARKPLIVMLSAYGDYSFVRDAFVLGAYDYMLKSDLDESYLASVIEKIVRELNTRQQDRIVRPQEEDSEDKEVIATVLRLATSSTPSSTDKDYVRRMIGEKNNLVAIIRFANVIEARNTHDMIVQTLRSVIESWDKECSSWVCQIDERHYCLFFSCPSHMSTMTVRMTVNGILSSAMIRLQQFLNLSFAIGISDQGRAVEDWSRLYRQAERLSGLAYYEGYDRLYYPESDKPLTAIADMQDEDWKKTWSLSKAALLKAITDPEKAAWREKLAPCMDKLVERFPAESNAIVSALGELIWDLGSLLYQKELSWNDVLNETQGEHPIEELRKLSTIRESSVWIEQLIEQLRMVLKPMQNDAEGWLSRPVAKAKAFVDKHYNEEIHLSTISKLVGVSESYLSKQFAKEIGNSFIQYLTQLRITKAKEALQAGHRIYDVSEMVGYVNAEHFSRIFKKITGVSPKSYRQDQR